MQAFEHPGPAGFNIFIELSVVHVVPRIIEDNLTATESASVGQVLATA